MTQRCVQVYTGDGKGKTTAAFGLVVRASGHGMKSYVAQFMKGQNYGELQALENDPHITIEQFGDKQCIRRDQVTEEHRVQARAGLTKAREAMLAGSYNIIVLDEINVAVWFGLLAVQDLLDLLDDRPDSVELVFTGRRAPEQLVERAHLVTEMKPVKHYYDEGLVARPGIEY
jgi:cob(I)alamin adenosyltransferase